MSDQKIKGFKAFNADWTCRGFQYEVGQTYLHSGPITMCESGFHFCPKAIDVMEFYGFDAKAYRYAEVEGVDCIRDSTKIVCKELTICREIPFAEFQILVNSGDWNSGYGNSGDRNSGYRNSGDRNSGYGNSGDRNSGDRNSGDGNSGNRNSGDRNSGYRNSGNRNSGYRNSGNRNSGDGNSGYGNSGDRNSGNRNSGDGNSGNRNSGDRNSGDRNSGDGNSGYGNSGYRNSGNRNSGDGNSGDRNSGDWNSGDWNTGYFNSHTPRIISVFNQPLDRDKWDQCRKPDFLFALEDGWKAAYRHASRTDRALLTQLPNFDAQVFYEISGIDIDDPSTWLFDDAIGLEASMRRLFDD